MARKYYAKSPRGFANEVHFIHAGTPEECQELEDAGFERITREQLRKQVSFVNYENDCWGSNRAFGRIPFAALTDPRHPEYVNYSAAAWRYGQWPGRGW